MTNLSTFAVDIINHAAVHAVTSKVLAEKMSVPVPKITGSLASLIKNNLVTVSDDKTIIVTEAGMKFVTSPSIP